MDIKIPEIVGLDLLKMIKEQIPPDIRIVAATNKDVHKLLSENSFLEDL